MENEPKKSFFNENISKKKSIKYLLVLAAIEPSEHISRYEIRKRYKKRLNFPTKPAVYKQLMILKPLLSIDIKWNTHYYQLNYEVIAKEAISYFVLKTKFYKLKQIDSIGEIHKNYTPKRTKTLNVAKPEVLMKKGSDKKNNLNKGVFGPAIELQKIINEVKANQKKLLDGKEVQQQCWDPERPKHLLEEKEKSYKRHLDSYKSLISQKGGIKRIFVDAIWDSIWSVSCNFDLYDSITYEKLLLLFALKMKEYTSSRTLSFDTKYHKSPEDMLQTLKLKLKTLSCKKKTARVHKKAIQLQRRIQDLENSQEMIVYNLVSDFIDSQLLTSL